ncbi:MAG: hypothetical protein GKS06_20250 [Acidobacteria bacterium]|nr:hypothetical protein [Acidobacteriota bacterium]
MTEKLKNAIQSIWADGVRVLGRVKISVSDGESPESQDPVGVGAPFANTQVVVLVDGGRPSPAGKLRLWLVALAGFAAGAAVGGAAGWAIATGSYDELMWVLEILARIFWIGVEILL